MDVLKDLPIGGIHSQLEIHALAEFPAIPTHHDGYGMGELLGALGGVDSIRGVPAARECQHGVTRARRLLELVARCIF